MKTWLKNVALRLIDLAALSITAYLLIYLLLKAGILEVPLLFLSEAFNSLPPYIAYTFLLLVGFSLPLFLRKHNCYNITHTIKNDLRHPPAYLASFFVITFSLYADDLSGLIDIHHATLFSAGTFICLLTMTIKQTKKKNNKPENSTEFDINVWLEKEAPVENSIYDLNNIHTYVNRIHERLVNKNEKESHQIAIRGDFGTGKSSLCRLLENRASLSKEKHFIYCYIDGWGREDSSFAGQILEIIINKLSEYVDCSSLTNVPENYMNALNSTGLNSATAFAQFFTSIKKTNPEQYLNEINKILININLHMVVVLEDFDRGPKPATTINELASLLERLKSLKNINFLLCVKRDETTLIDKICNHIEDILPIGDSTVETIIKLFIQSITSDHKDIIFVGDFSNYVAPKNIGVLLKTPRKLKTALRRTKTAWKNIKGEVNFSDLLHINIIRSAEPIFLTFIENAIAEIRKASESNDDNIKQSLAGRIKHECECHNLDQVAVFSIFYRLFPETLTSIQLEEEHIETFRTNRYASILSGSYTNKTQSITNTRCNYLYRAITESLPDEEARDQDIISAIYSSSTVALTNLRSITEEKVYESYLNGLIDWILDIEEFRNLYCENLAEIINHEFTHLSKPKTSLFFNVKLTFDRINKSNGKRIHLLCNGIERIAGKTDSLDSKNMITALQKSIYEHILDTNSSIAIELIQHFFENHFLKEKFSSFMFDHIKNNSCKRIFESMDPKDTAFIDLMFKCYKLDNGSHDDDHIDPSEFHKFLFKSGFNPKADLLPMIIYHFDKSAVCETHSIDDCWNKSDMRDLILNFEIGNDTKYQYGETLTKQLAKWKDYATRNFDIPLSKNPPVPFDLNGREYDK